MNIVFLFFSLNALANQTLYISSVKAKLYSEPKVSSQLIGELNRNDAIEVLDTQGVWLKTLLKGKSAWISKIFTSQNPPLKADDVSRFNKIDPEKVGRVRLNYENKGAARGLVESGPKGSRNGYQDNQKIFEGIQFIKNQKIETNDIQNFRSEGKLKQ